MKKKLLILMCVMMMFLFGSVLTVSAEEIEENITYWVSVDNLSYNNTGTTFLHGCARLEYSTALPVGGYLWKSSDDSVQTFVRFLYLNESGKVYALNMPVVDREIIENSGQSTSTEESYFPLGSSRSSVLYNCEYLSGVNSDKTTVNKFSSNMPIFSDYDSCVNYLKTGDLTGNLNDLTDTDKMDEDSSFGFTGFTAGSTGKLGAIKASWTGTTHDDKIDTYKEAKYTVHAAYAWKNDIAEVATPIASVTSNMFRGDISELGFLKMYSYFTPENENTYLRYLKVVPYYTVGDGLFGVSKKGLPVTIWLDENGDIESIEDDNGHGGGGSSDGEYDSSFYLQNVKCAKDLFSYLANDVKYTVSWSGTSHDDIVATLSPSDTNVFVYCIGENASGDKKKYDYFSFDPLLNELHISQKFGVMTNMYNEFCFEDNYVVGNIEVDGYSFNGEIYLVPQYKTSGRKIIRGCITSVNVYTGEIKNIVGKDPYDDSPADDDDDNVIVNPPDGGDDDGDDVGLPDIGEINDIPSYLLNLFQSFLGFVGAVPNLLAAIFPFLPKEINYLLSMGLLIVVVLRILGR